MIQFSPFTAALEVDVGQSARTETVRGVDFDASLRSRHWSTHTPSPNCGVI
jgi:hypothetical protein